MRPRIAPGGAQAQLRSSDRRSANEQRVPRGRDEITRATSASRIPARSSLQDSQARTPFTRWSRPRVHASAAGHTDRSRDCARPHRLSQFDGSRQVRTAGSQRQRGAIRSRPRFRDELDRSSPATPAITNLKDRRGCRLHAAARHRGSLVRPSEHIRDTSRRRTERQKPRSSGAYEARPRGFEPLTFGSVADGVSGPGPPARGPSGPRGMPSRLELARAHAALGSRERLLRPLELAEICGAGSVSPFAWAELDPRAAQRRALTRQAASTRSPTRGGAWPRSPRRGAASGRSPRRCS
jgi:hypothetical protein